MTVTGPRGPRRWAALLVVLLVAAPLRARAEPAAADQATAEALFQDAMKLVANHQDQAACPKLEQSQSLDPAIGTLFRLAECYEAIGRTASAWTAFVQVAALAGATGQAERERVARERASRVEPRLSRLTIAVDSPDIPGLEIRRGSAIVDRGQWGKPVPLDPSEYILAAAAPGRVTWRRSVTITGNGESQTLTVPALAEMEPSIPATPSTRAGVGSPTDEARGGPLRTVGLLVAGAGVVGVGAGSVFGAIAITDKNAANSSGCTGNQCTLSSGATRDQARNAADLSTAFLVAGGALVVGGLTLWLVSPRSGTGSAPATVGLGLGLGAMALRGSW